MGYVVGDCSLGEDLRFEIPNDVESGDLIVKDGELYNATSGNIVIVCDSYPDHYFLLGSMGGLQYRASGYSYVDCPLTVTSGPVLPPALSDLVLFGALLISALTIICRGGAKRD